MPDKYRLERTLADNKWDQFVMDSENGSLFLYGKYLNALNTRTGLYYCYKNKELRAALAIIEDSTGENAILHDFVIYNGILMGKSTTGQNRAQRISEQFQIGEFIAKELPSLYKSIKISLHPTWIDARPFLWFNYQTEKPKYIPDIRYTSYVNISDFSDAENMDDIDVYQNSSKARRQEIRYAMREGVITEELFDTEMFIQLYEKTIERQSISIDKSKSEEMAQLLNVLEESGLGIMLASWSGDKELASMACFGIDNKRAYYLFGSNEPELRDTHAGSATIWNSFRLLNERGVNEIDLEGVNSPYRGWFKLSFGGDLRPYYEFSLIN